MAIAVESAGQTGVIGLAPHQQRRDRIAIFLAAAICLPAAESAKPNIRTAALAIPTGAPVRIKTTAKQTVQGKLTAVTSDGITLQVVDRDVIADRSVPFSEMESIKQTNKPMSSGKVVLITLAVLYGIGLLIGLAVGGA